MHSLFINGIASSFGSNLLSDQFLKSLNPALESFTSNVTKRFSVLSESYLKQTTNQDFSAAQHFASQSPSELAVSAVQKLLAKCNVKVEQIGLVLADTVTPRQTIPAEAQRVCRLLGIKVPCFDINSGPLAFPNFFQTLLRWKVEKIPEYVLLISTNSPSERINYATDSLAFVMSDASVAMLVSTKHAAPLRVRSVNISVGQSSPVLSIPIFGAVSVTSKQDLTPLEADLDLRFSVATTNVAYKEYGYSFGATFGVGLEKLASKSEPLVVACGHAGHYATVLLECGGLS